MLRLALGRRLTPLPAAVVILSLAALAGPGCLAYYFIAAAVVDARVRAAMPTVCAQIREQPRTLGSGNWKSVE
jgi:hypothetical protein